MKKIISVIMITLMLLTCLVPIASAAEKCSMVIDFNCEEKLIPEAEFNLYLVAEDNGNGKYLKTGSFAALPVELNNLSTDEMVNAATALNGLILLNAIKPDYTGKTDANGIYVFDNLKPGMYLLTGKNTIYDSEIYSVKPTLYILPAADENGSPANDIRVIPKSEHFPLTGMPTRAEVEVHKTWKDNGFKDRRPENITAVLYCDGEFYESVLLNNDNGWSYEWRNLAPYSSWTVVEKIPDGYFYTVIRNGESFIFVNTVDLENPPETTTTEPTTEPETSETVETTDQTDTTKVTETTNTTGTTNPSGPEIPNTGLLTWPVTVFSIIGAFLLIIGWAFIRKSKYNEEA